MYAFSVRSLRLFARATAVIVAGLALQACENLKENLIGKEVAEFTPFAQETVSIVGVQSFEMKDSDLVFLRGMVTDDFVELDELQQKLAIVDDFRSRVIAYSVELVSLAQRRGLTDADRVAAYADGLDYQLRKEFIDYVGVSTAEWDEVLANIRQQDDLLGALRVAQPFVVEAQKAYEILIDEISQDIFVRVVEEFDLRIQAEYGHTRQFWDRQYEARDTILAAMNAVYDYKMGNPTAFADYRRTATPYGRDLIARNNYAAADLAPLYDSLAKELSISTSLLDEMKQDREDYIATLNELDVKSNELYTNLDLARRQFLNWARAHQALANGVMDAAKWLSVGLDIFEAVSG